MILLNQVLFASLVIIGVYILAIALFRQPVPTKQAQPYHLGCFMVQHDTSHSQKLINSINALTSKRKSSLNYRTISFSDDLIEQKSLELARSVQLFLADYNHQREQQRSYYELFQATKIAYENYKNCSLSLEMIHFSENDCQNIWLDYTNCSSTLSLYKADLNDFFKQKYEINQKIMAIFQVKKVDKAAKPVKNDEERQYKIRDRQLEMEQKKIQLSIKLKNEKIATTKYNYGVSQNESSNSLKLYKQCSEHRKQFKLCQQLSNEVRNLGHGTMESLAHKLQRKRQSIFKIQGMLHDDSNNHMKQNLMAMQKTSLDEYKKLHKIFAQIKIKLVKNCGCTQSQQQKLLQTYQQHKQQEQKIKKLLIELQEKEKKKHDQLHLIKGQRQALFQQLQNRLKSKLTVIVQQQISPFQNLLPLQDQLRQIKNKIYEIQPKFLKLAQKCQTTREQLSSMLPSISSVSDCLNKRQYYFKLQQSLSKFKHKFNNKLQLPSKSKLIQIVQDFNI